jgi:UDP-N-acetylglucosamine diphosphorylase / glucose-1-phosphate thymidylyltransferase / UDP-N-acetylgalactosamine diphosphorylase / glucosamine-1-phosphate N-acetyltransferase / galactosamine-1-phosphate N-acetyltransferase
MPLKGVILAAGKGTRMKELTRDVPKPLLDVAGRPVLEHILTGLRDAGVAEACVIVGYRGEAIREHFGDGSRLKMRLHYVEQAVQDGTGKAPELAREFVGGDSFVLSYGDILVSPGDYKNMTALFGREKPDALQTVKRGEDVTKGAVACFDRDFYMTDLIEKPTPEQLEALVRAGKLQPGAPAWYNSGIYIFTPRVFEFTARLQKSVRGEYELTDALIAMCRAGLRIRGCELMGRWADVRDPEVLAELRQTLAPS